ncbi:MAG: FkbM family methyltransferase [Candidatus Paceibacterota bacterium]|jgi:FkbM family methyltransferase
MAFHETNWQKFNKLLQNPKANIGKILPFIKSKLVPYQRDLYEFLGSEKYSHPYSGHEAFLKYIQKKNGFFVQCGGYDGYSNDPSYYLEKFKGWTGIMAEPIPPLSHLCQKNRKNSKVVQSACVAFSHQGKTTSFMDCSAMSFVKGSIENSVDWIKASESCQDIKCREIIVPARTIQSIIDDQIADGGDKKIDLFIADVEGYELEVLKGLDFLKNSPTYILVEIQNDDKLQRISDFLSPQGYKLLEQIGENDALFIKQ